MQCPICKSKFDHPVRRGRRSRFCGPLCRAKNRKEWRRLYDASEPVKAKKRKREMDKWWREHPKSGV